MNFETPKNKNYAAVVVKIKTIVPLDNCDNVVATPLFGFQAVVGKNTQVGDMGIVFPAETRLSENYCAFNNLYRHAENNADQTQKGYLEENRRVKAVKFRGHQSDCLFMPLSSLEWTGVKTKDFKEGDEFDVLNGQPICEKYERPIVQGRAQQVQKKAFKRVTTKQLPEHYDNENYFRNQDFIPNTTEIIVTQKLHGTSIRIGHTIVLRQPRFIDRLARFMGVAIKESEFDYVYGSRKVIKDVNNPNQQHYYETDVWSNEGKKLMGLLPQNYIVYGELVGYTETGAPIQKNYTYQNEPGTCTLYVYRVAIVNAEGVIYDLSWDHLREFCKQRGLQHVKELWRGPKDMFNPADWIDKRFADMGLNLVDAPVKLDEKSPVDEGVCIRIDTIVPTIYKAKSPIFLQHETDLIDQGAEDLEAEQSAESTL